ncbi:STE3-like pheromone receptor, partial [Vararia minispora EC-137]
PPNEFFIVFGFISFILAFIPFYWHLRAANVGTCLFMAWAGLSCLNSSINAIIWNHNVINSAPVWCDISTRFMVGVSMGLPASCLVILARLYKISSLKSAQMTRGERHRELIMDLSVGLGLPVLHTTLEVVINANRFQIWEGYGCTAEPWPTWLTWLIFYPWPFVVTVVACIFGGLAYWHLRRRALQAQEFESSNRAINSARYQRLLSMTAVVLTFTLIVGIGALWTYAQLPLQPQITWAEVHADYDDIVVVPRALMTSTQLFGLEMQRWAAVISALVFFAFFGLADEARLHYRKAYTTLCSVTGLT